uniref:Threonylcarbamoyl-AMP synthase n=1 Tax=Biomphalaria glabrata TaxID=6526 RepID=A0A2C9JHS2_BIOGL
MASIRPSSALIATLFTHFIIFVVVAVFNFSIVDNALPINFGLGISLMVLSLTALLLVVTSQDPETSLLRSLLMSISGMWTAIGLYHVVQFFTPVVLNDSEALWAGYGTFLLAYLFFIGGALHHKDRFSAILALGMFLSCIFEIASLWRPIRRSAAAYYLLLAAVTFYMTVSKLWHRFRSGESRKVVVGGDPPRPSRDYIPMAHLMNTLAAAVYAGQVTGIYRHASAEFTWVIVGGFYQLVAAVVAVRRNEIYHGLYFIFHATFWITNGFNLTVVFVTGQNVPLTLVAATVIHFIIFAIIALISLTREIYQLPQNLALCVLCVAILVDDNNNGAFLGAMGWILFVFSLYGLAAHISRVKNSGFKLPLGTRLIDPEKVANFFLTKFKFLSSHAKTIDISSSPSKSLFSADFSLGYSRYGGFDIAGFALNAIAAVAILWAPNGLWVLPWAVILGGIAQMIVGSICFAKGLSFESCAFFTFGSLWLIWGPARGLGTLAFDNSAAIITGCVGFLAVGLLLLGLSTIINKAWTLLTFLFNLIIVGQLLNAVSANGSFIYEIVITVLFVVVCMYCFVATALRSVWGKELLPLGKPFLQVSYLHSQGEQAFWADGRRASGVKAIADIMNKGGICGIPTDTVYTLVAACKFPDSVERAYNTKKLAEDRPMSMWISKVEQLEAGRELFGELVWGLMNEIWPSTVSLVVPKGEWLQGLGIGASEKYIGRPDSIACRMPDNTVTSHLIDQTGPIAVTSANPTGEADTTHHLQVLAKLGLENCDGILCSGPSPENMASTVVDCRALSKEGKLAFFRIGVVPRSQVEAMFAKVRLIQEGGVPPTIAARTSVGNGCHLNSAFVDDQNNPMENVPVYDDTVVVNDHHDNDDDNDETGAPPAPSPDNNASFDVSFAESTVEDDAQLINITSLAPPRPIKSITGKMNKVYESLNPLHRRSQKAAGGSGGTALNQSLDSEGDSVSTKSSSAGSDAYEPMQVRRKDSDYNAKVTPAASFNPMFEDDQVQTKL